LREKVNAKTKLVFIANPNNPTGTYVSKDAFDAFVSGLPETVIVVLDEAYDTFIDVKDYPHGSDYVGKQNVLVLKTFSKAYGLSGLRVGYCVGEPRFCAFMEKTRQPFNINSLAQAGALAALDDKAFLRTTRSVVLAGKKYLYKQLAALELAYVPSVANFILVDVGRDCVEVFRELLKRGVIVRDMKQYGLGNFIRVTIGTLSENRRFIAALGQVLEKTRKTT
jgi:histidinol-phosphate aminotransferase